MMICYFTLAKIILDLFTQYNVDIDKYTLSEH